MRNKIGVLFLTACFVAVAVFAQEVEESDELTDIASEAEEVVIDPNAPPSTERGCFSIRRVRNFSSLGDEYLYVQEAGNAHFLLTMFPSCFGLRNARAIAIENHQDRVCSNSQADVTFRGVGGRRESCLILAVEEVEDRDAARTLFDMRAERQR